MQVQQNTNHQTLNFKSRYFKNEEAFHKLRKYVMQHNSHLVEHTSEKSPIKIKFLKTILQEIFSANEVNELIPKGQIHLVSNHEKRIINRLFERGQKEKLIKFVKTIINNATSGDYIVEGKYDSAFNIIKNSIKDTPNKYLNKKLYREKMLQAEHALISGLMNKNTKSFDLNYYELRPIKDLRELRLINRPHENAEFVKKAQTTVMGQSIWLN